MLCYKTVDARDKEESSGYFWDAACINMKSQATHMILHWVSQTVEQGN